MICTPIIMLINIIICNLLGFMNDGHFTKEGIIILILIGMTEIIPVVEYTIKETRRK